MRTKTLNMRSFYQEKTELIHYLETERHQRFGGDHAVSKGLEGYGRARQTTRFWAGFCCGSIRLNAVADISYNHEKHLHAYSTTWSSEILLASCKEWKVNVRPLRRLLLVPEEARILVKPRGRPQKAKRGRLNPSAFELANWLTRWLHVISRTR